MEEELKDLYGPGGNLTSIKKMEEIKEESESAEKDKRSPEVRIKMMEESPLVKWKESLTGT
jgi:hypothetical protein